jgi:hypothetical protein
VVEVVKCRPKAVRSGTLWEEKRPSRRERYDSMRSRWFLLSEETVRSSRDVVDGGELGAEVGVDVHGVDGEREEGDAFDVNSIPPGLEVWD